MNYYNEIKQELIKNQINRKVKNYSINTYYNVRKMMSEAGKHYGEGIIKEYSQKLRDELEKSYSVRYII